MARRVLIVLRAGCVQHLSFFYLTFNMMRPFLIVWLLPRRSFATFQPPVEKVWRAQWNSMRAMVAELDPPPPVVKFGAESLASFNGAIEREFRFQALVATMLSPQTRDAQVALAIERLCAVSPTGNLLPSLVATWDVNTVEGAIRSTLGAVPNGKWEKGANVPGGGRNRLKVPPRARLARGGGKEHAS